MEKDAIKNNINAVVSRQDKIKLAYLFGSIVREDRGKLSDNDIAVYFDGADKRQMAELKLKLLTELNQALETDQIDLVVLNTTDQPELKYQIISEGELIYEQEPYKIIVEPLILNEEKIIETSLTDKLAGMVGFRNIITHDYGKIDYDIVYDVLHNRLEDLEDIDKLLNIAEQIR